MGFGEQLQGSFFRNISFKNIKKIGRESDRKTERERERSDSAIASHVIHHRYCRRITPGNCIFVSLNGAVGGGMCTYSYV